MARPSTLSPEIAATLYEATREGATRKAAAEAAGISMRTLMRWLAKGRYHEDQRCVYLLAALEQAQSDHLAERYHRWLGQRLLRGRMRR